MVVKVQVVEKGSSSEVGPIVFVPCLSLFLSKGSNRWHRHVALTRICLPPIPSGSGFLKGYLASMYHLGCCQFVLCDMAVIISSTPSFKQPKRIRAVNACYCQWLVTCFSISGDSRALHQPG
jgi:hypothetical protein